MPSKPHNTRADAVRPTSPIPRFWPQRWARPLGSLRLSPGDRGAGREADLDLQASFGPGPAGEGGAVRGGDRADDRQAQSVPVAAAAPGRGQPLERLHEPTDLTGRDHQPVI